MVRQKENDETLADEDDEDEEVAAAHNKSKRGRRKSSSPTPVPKAKAKVKAKAKSKPPLKQAAGPSAAQVEKELAQSQAILSEAEGFINVCKSQGGLKEVQTSAAKALHKNVASGQRGGDFSISTTLTSILMTWESVRWTAWRA